MTDRRSKDLSEIRRNPVSGDWSIIATGRARRPDEFHSREKQESYAIDPFWNPEKSGNTVVYTLPETGPWWVKVIKNKFPVVEGNRCGIQEEAGPYTVQPGAGYHEVVISKDPHRSLGEMSHGEVELIVEAYIHRYEALRALECATYILIFHNHGLAAGASLPHPHSQIIALPFVPPDVSRSLSGSKAWFEKRGECVHCAMLAWERNEKRRVVFEDEYMIALSPYVPHQSYELRLYPKAHSSSFEKMHAEEKVSFARSLRVLLHKVHQGLNNSPYNFFIHTAPAKSENGESYAFYHWHVELFPIPPTPPAGFELGSGVDVSMIDPDDLAAYLRKIPMPTEY